MAMRKGLPAKLALTDADDTRYDFRNLVVSNADGTPRGGLTAPVGTNVITGSATMNVSVGAFAGGAVRDGGVILLANDGPVNVLLDAAPVSNSRWDLICARQDDASSTVTTPDADNLPKLYFVKGTAASTPTAPALPAGSVEVGRVLVTAGNTNTNSMTIKQADVYTAGSGATVPFRTLTALQDWTTAQIGQQARVRGDSSPANNINYEWSGLAWVVSNGDQADITSFGPGWGPVDAGANRPRVVRAGRQVSLYGSVTIGAAGSYGTILTVPTAFRPLTGTTRAIGVSVNNQNPGIVMELFMTNGAISWVAQYATGAPTFNKNVPLAGCNWLMD